MEDGDTIGLGWSRDRGAFERPIRPRNDRGAQHPTNDDDAVCMSAVGRNQGPATELPRHHHKDPVPGRKVLPLLVDAAPRLKGRSAVPSSFWLEKHRHDGLVRAGGRGVE